MERRSGAYVVVRQGKALETPSAVGDFIEDIWDQRAATLADEAHANACDLGIGCY